MWRGCWWEFAGVGQILTPMRNQAPPQKIERTLAGLVVLADDQQFLARRAVPPPRIVRQAAVAHVESIDECVTERPRGLNDPTTHERRRSEQFQYQLRLRRCSSVAGAFASSIPATMFHGAGLTPRSRRSIAWDERCAPGRADAFEASFRNGRSCAISPNREQRDYDRFRT